MPPMDDRLEMAAHEDGAVFAPAPVRSSRGPRVLAVAVLVSVGGLVAIGALDRLPASETALDGGPAAGSAVSASAQTPSVAPHRARTELPSNRFTYDPIVQPIDFDVRSIGSDLFVHGDVFSLDVSRVSVTLEDSAGHVAARQAVDLPGGSTGFRLGAVPRFDVHFVVPHEVQTGGFVVSATAMDSKGHRLTTIEERILRSPVSM